jgi:dethiobiotin synthetase
VTPVFIAGAHTDVGKTHVACALIEAARRRGLDVEALKPVVSGFDEANWAESDPGRLLAALGREATPQALEAISPWRFAAPLAPPLAARLEGCDLPLAPIIEFCRLRLESSTMDLVIVEGVGGLMSPIAQAATGLDLVAALGAPVVLVGGSYLGAISHMLTALETLRARAFPIVAAVISESAPPAPDFGDTASMLIEHATPVPVIAAPRGVASDWPQRLLDGLG